MLKSRLVLKTKRLELKPTRPEHAEGLIDAIRVSRAELEPWLAWAEASTPDETRAFTRVSAREWQAHTSWGFTIFHGGAIAGSVGLNRYEPLLQSASLGYWMSTSLAGRGLMTEAASAVVDYGFGELGLHRIELHAAPENHASVRVAEKIGFKRGGLLRDGSRGTRGFHDVWVFDLLATDERRRWH